MSNVEQNHSWLEHHSDLKLVGENIAWLNEQRQQALAHFEQIGLPSIRDEQWRYTNLRALKSNAYSAPLARDADIELPSNLLSLLSSNNTQLVFIDGRFSARYSNLSALDEDITFCSLATILTESPELIEPHFGTTLSKEQHGFTALNSAYCQDGYVLLLPKNKVLNNPLEAIFINSDLQQEQTTLTHMRNLLIANANSECTLVERHIGIDGRVYLNNSVTEVIANDNAHIDHYKLQQESNEAFHIGGVFIQQSANAQVKNHNIALSGLVIRNDIHSSLNGEGAHIEMNGLVMGAGRQHCDNHTQVNHFVPHCNSDEYYKTILNDKARSVFRGRIVVAQDAQQTNADQQNNNLLLSKDAEADTLPQLEIYADDVKCSHGATVGQLDEAALFYLKSRGINQPSATALLTFAFANEVINRIKLDSIREELTQLIAGQLLNTDIETNPSTQA